ncbi:kelch-like protein 5 isoform X2 [Arctopsyche grandis]
MCERKVRMKTHSDPTHLKRGFERLYEMMEQEKFCDVDVIIGSESFPVHKNVMAAYSDYFIDLGQNVDDQPRARAIIRDVDSNAMKQVIEYCYTGNINLQEDIVEKIFNVAGILQMQPLLKVCADFLEAIIDVKNCIRIAKLATLYNNADLEDSTKDFIGFNFNEVICTEEFLNIEFNILLDLVKSDDLNVSSEMTVFKSVQRWAQHDFSNRKDHFSSLIEFIKLPLLPVEVLFDEVQPLVNEKCLSIVVDAIQWKTIPSRRPQLDSPRNIPRKSAIVALAIGDWFSTTSEVVMVYDPETELMSELMNLETETRNFSAVILGDEIIIMAGFISNTIQYIDKVDSYKIKTGSKTSLPPMLQTRYHPVVAVIDGLIYAAGGNDGKAALKTMERYNPMSKIWTFVNPMPTARYDAGGAVLNNELFVIGGFNGSSPLNVVESYCSFSGKWRQCAPTNVARNWPGVAVAGGYIYAVGGSMNGCLGSAERYDAKTNSWSMIADISVPRYAIGVCGFGDNLLAYGGSCNGTKTELEEYNAATNQWRSITSHTKRGHFNFIAMPKRWIKRIKADSKKNLN